MEDETYGRVMAFSKRCENLPYDDGPGTSVSNPDVGNLKGPRWIHTEAFCTSYATLVNMM